MSLITRTYDVRIFGDGQVHVDHEPQHVPLGVDPAQVAVHVLRLHAASGGAAVTATVRDDRSSAQFTMQVNPDGTTEPPADGTLAMAAPTASPPARLAAAQAAGRAHDWTVAIAEANALLEELSAEHASTAPQTLEVARFRADLAWLSGDFAYATSAWVWLALTALDQNGPGSQTTREAAGKAAAAWMRLPLPEARTLAKDLMAMLLEVAPQEQTVGMRRQIEGRVNASA
ncbi:hypothetical protein OIE69_44035 (plasmid) [Actinacidiphila glaucinigra]|uniref:hypothetical protein n=1 Tax=Actinacidiphila glaucinigra TaxID=235986 RepID=UPI002DD9DD9B|nr:hypothetical protein [Actinacidiphila glaucinigra]WSD65876.1 hypothetical protein OIE69_44035 [Actinacidiphila glaucinigra]